MAAGGGVSLTVGGVKELTENLTTVTGSLQAMAVMGEIAKQTAAVAKSYAPTVSGALRSSIKAGKSKNRAVVKAGNSRVAYAAAINFGWARRNIKPSQFMQRADATMRPRLPKILDDALRRLIHEGHLS